MISLGDSGVGKSALIKRHCEHRFVSRYAMTIGIDYGVIKALATQKQNINYIDQLVRYIQPKIQSKVEDISISIFDVGGHDVFKEVRQEFYAETEAALLVFDVKESNPVVGLERWIDEFTSGGGSTKNALVIVGP